MYDVIILGIGIAGLTAGLYAARKGMSTLVVGEAIGGQIMYASRLENFPGYSGDGYGLVSTLQKQAEESGAKIATGKIVRIKKEKERFEVILADGRILEARTIIITTGKVARKLGAKGEDKFLGRGVHVCATCDAPLYSGKRVVVIGGGNSAVDAAINLSGIAKKVYLVNINEKCNAEQVLISKVKSMPNVEILPTSIIREIKGEQFVSSVEIEDTKSGEAREIEADGVFIEIGYVVDPSLFEGLIKLNVRNEIITNEKGQTSDEGIFAAGDVTNTIFKQAIIAAGCGAKAALSAHAYLTSRKIEGDWKG